MIIRRKEPRAWGINAPGPLTAPGLAAIYYCIPFISRQHILALRQLVLPDSSTAQTILPIGTIERPEDPTLCRLTF
jgi:hypothetical protein